MFIVENVGQTEAFFKKGHFTSTGISSVKNIQKDHTCWRPWRGVGTPGSYLGWVLQNQKLTIMIQCFVSGSVPHNLRTRARMTCVLTLRAGLPMMV